MSTNIAEAIPRLRKLIPRLRGKRIGVLGDLMLDRYLWGTASRLSPEAPIPVIDFVEQNECLGGSGNVAAKIAKVRGKIKTFGVICNYAPRRSLRQCRCDDGNWAEGGPVQPQSVNIVETPIMPC